MNKAQNDPYSMPHFVATAASEWSELQHLAAVDRKQAVESVSDVPHPKKPWQSTCIDGKVSRSPGDHLMSKVVVRLRHETS